MVTAVQTLLNHLIGSLWVDDWLTASPSEDPFIVKNCGPYATEQLTVLIDMLKAEGAEFIQAQQVQA